MADEKLNITIEGAKDLFKNLEAQLSKIATAMDKVTKKTAAQTAATKKLSDVEKKALKQKKAFRKVMSGLNVATQVSKGEIGGAASALAAMNPYTAVASKSIGVLASLVKQVYELFLGYNRRLLETGDVMGNLDLSTGGVIQAMNKLNAATNDIQRSLWGGNMSMKEILGTMKGFTTAGLMVTDLKDRLGGLKEATRIVTTYSKLFTMDTAEMATSVGMFVREMNLSSTATTNAFSQIYNASLDARYGTSNFLRIVNVAIPAISNFGGSIKEVSRFLQMMGKTGIISMRQAQETVGAIFSGIKKMTWEQRLYASALVKTDDMLKIMKNRAQGLQKQIQLAGNDVRALARLNYEADELRRDIAAVEERGSRLSIARAMQRFGATEVLEMTFKQAERIMGKQLTTLHQLATVSGREQALLVEFLQGQGLSQDTFEIMKRLLYEGVEYDGKTLKTPEQLIKAMRESDEFRKSYESEFESDAQKAAALRAKTENKIENTLEIIKNTFVNKLMPIMDELNSWLTSLSPEAGLEGAITGFGLAAEFVKGLTTGGLGTGIQAVFSKTVNTAMGKTQAATAGAAKHVATPLAVPSSLLAAGKEYKAFKTQMKEWLAEKEKKSYWRHPEYEGRAHKLIGEKKAELGGTAKSAAFYKPIVDILKKAAVGGSSVTMSKEIHALVMSIKDFKPYVQGVTINIQGDDVQKMRKEVVKVLGAVGQNSNKTQ